MLAMSGLSCIVMAQGNQEHRYRPDQRGKVTQAHRAQHLELDQRYHHDHYYPRQGYPMTILPGGSIGIHFGNGQFYFHGGVWFRPIGSRFVVSLPPLGIVVPVLPPAVVTLWIAGAPYYYANGVYYATTPGQGYTVVAPPSDAITAQPITPTPVPSPTPTVVPVPMPAPIIYPRNGQSAEQTEIDRQECNRWATTQPTPLADAEVFQRAVAACMDGRGHSLR